MGFWLKDVCQGYRVKTTLEGKRKQIHFSFFFSFFIKLCNVALGDNSAAGLMGVVKMTEVKFDYSNEPKLLT